MAATHAVSDYMQEIPLQKLSYAPGQHALDGSRGGGGECFCPGGYYDQCEPSLSSQGAVVPFQPLRPLECLLRPLQGAPVHVFLFSRGGGQPLWGGGQGVLTERSKTLGPITTKRYR